MLASKRADVASTFVARTFAGDVESPVGGSLRSAIDRGRGESDRELKPRTDYGIPRRRSDATPGQSALGAGIRQPKRWRAKRFFPPNPRAGIRLPPAGTC